MICMAKVGSRPGPHTCCQVDCPSSNAEECNEDCSPGLVVQELEQEQQPGVSEQGGQAPMHRAAGGHALRLAAARVSVL